MFFNKETGILSVYRLDSYMDIGPTVSLLSYAKGDGRLPDYAPDFFPQLLEASLMGSTHVPRLFDQVSIVWGLVH
jgi:hypothetical protein